MKMVWHQAQGMNLPSGFFASLSQRFKEEPAILIIVENGFPAVAAIHDMVYGSRILHSQFSRHADILPTSIQASTSKY